MRQRITFLQEPQHSTDPKTLKIDNASISTTEAVKAAREDRITLGFDELPQELYLLLKASHELHIRWISPNAFETIAPLVAHLSPGLHVFYTPQRNRNTSPLLCPTLKRVFGDIECLSHEQTFSNLPTDRFSHSAATQYHHSLESLHELVQYATHKVCSPTNSSCLSRVTSLLSASSLDIDFDTISHALTITAFWAPFLQHFTFTSPTPKDRLEVGILTVAPPKEPEELTLGGFLTVLGEHKNPKPTQFSFPSRHHPFYPTFSATFLSPTGTHPTLQLNLTSISIPTDERTCSLHAHLTLPRAVFADKYQLSDPLFLRSQNISTIHHITSPVDLEAPAYAMSIWGSSVLLELAPPPPSSSLNTKDSTPWTATIPLHLRYLPPTSNTSGISHLDIPYPVVFWACVADEGSKFPINPFDRVNLGYDGLFGPKTMFYHLSPQSESGRLVNSVAVPVLDLDRSRYVEAGTAGVVLLGFAWVMWCLLGVWRKSGYGSGSVREAVEEKKVQ